MTGVISTLPAKIKDDIMKKEQILSAMKHVKGILPGDHVHRLIDAVKMADGPYIEIGALAGASTIAIALAAEDKEILLSRVHHG